MGRERGWVWWALSYISFCDSFWIGLNRKFVLSQNWTSLKQPILWHTIYTICTTHGAKSMGQIPNAPTLNLLSDISFGFLHCLFVEEPSIWAQLAEDLAGWGKISCIRGNAAERKFLKNPLATVTLPQPEINSWHNATFTILLSAVSGLKINSWQNATFTILLSTVSCLFAKINFWLVT